MPNTIKVKSGAYSFQCEVTGSGMCRYCDAPIMWATTQRGKAIPLQPFAACAMFTESHFGHCRRTRYEQPVPPGIELTEQRWRHLLLLVHPDKHSDHGEIEALANDCTRWLLEQRGRLT